MKIPYLPQTPSANDIPAQFDACGIPFEKVCCVNWDTFPYCPEARVRLAYTDSHLLVHYSVDEQSVRAQFENDGGDVWTDSCMEIFVATGNGDNYINIECNCIGTLLVAQGEGRQNRTRLPKEQVDSIKRWASLGRKSFPQREEPTHWEVALAIPLEIIGQPKESLTFNVYKCGDALPTPHFLSLFPIHTAEPDFHQPKFFQKVALE